MEIGIAGLPNVGESALFNALTEGHAASSNASCKFSDA
ncbi:MAG: 50S ribosome-binding GTPase [Elusimicrobia bacterium]|nr:50S ribosome-binding GTPase [Elusimicrobiota bacterium]